MRVTEKPIRLIDQIILEIQDRNLLGDIKYICLNKGSEKQLLEDFKEEFYVEYEELGRVPNKRDLEDYLRMKILIDDTINKKEKYRLLEKAH